MNEIIKDHIEGTIYGNCIGDAIGMMTEFLSKEDANKYFGGLEKLEYHYKDLLQDRQRLKYEEADWTDDSDQMILIMRSLIRTKGLVDHIDFAKRLQTWLEIGFSELGDTKGVGAGVTTNKVLRNPEYRKDPVKIARNVWEKFNREKAANGAVMRTSVVGVFKYWSLEEVISNCIKFCTVTHADPRCQASCVAVVTAIALMLQHFEGLSDMSDEIPQEKLDTIIGHSFKEAEKHLVKVSKTFLIPDEVISAHTEELKHYMSIANIGDLNLADRESMGYTFKTMGAGFWALRQTDFRYVIESLTLEGGDADTNAAVAGGLLGCKLGKSKLPESWVTKLKFKNWLDAQISSFLKVLQEQRDNVSAVEKASNKENVSTEPKIKELHCVTVTPKLIDDLLLSKQFSLTDEEKRLLECSRKLVATSHSWCNNVEITIIDHNNIAFASFKTMQNENKIEIATNITALKRDDGRIHTVEERNCFIWTNNDKLHSSIKKLSFVPMDKRNSSNRENEDWIERVHNRKRKQAHPKEKVFKRTENYQNQEKREKVTPGLIRHYTELLLKHEFCNIDVINLACNLVSDRAVAWLNASLMLSGHSCKSFSFLSGCKEYQVIILPSSVNYTPEKNYVYAVEMHKYKCTVHTSSHQIRDRLEEINQQRDLSHQIKTTKTLSPVEEKGRNILFPDSDFPSLQNSQN